MLHININKSQQICSACAQEYDFIFALCTGDGISEMKVDPQKDAKSWKGFKECMDNITKAIPTKKHETTPLFLGATAGMRLLQ